MLQRLARNQEALRVEIARAARESGRDPREIRVVCVTKTVEPGVARRLYDLGCRDFGESRAQELEDKHAWFAAHRLSARWHFLGHVQRNKARRVVSVADTIHSVDSPELLDTLERVAADEGRWPAIYLQVKLTDEDKKTGIEPEELEGLVARARFSSLPLVGLMTMAPLPTETSAPPRETFERLASLATDLPQDAFLHGRPWLSMGMSGDFADAVRAGADVLRIGSAFFEGLEEPSRAEGGG